MTQPWRQAVALSVAAGAFRLVVAALTPLFPDETYYWEWSRRLAAGYYDHPPLIAWLIRGGTLLWGDTALGVRAGAVAAGTLATILLAATARQVAGDRPALWLAIAFAAMPLSAGLVLATPDAPLLAASAAALYCVVRAVQAPARTGSSLRWWCISGLALGVATTAKYTAVLLPLGIFVGLVARAELRARLLEPGPYVGTAIALAVFSPVILWNAGHDWVSFAFQLRHGLGAMGGSALNRELELLGGQAALVSPLLFFLFAAAVARGARRRSDPILGVLAIAAAVIFCFFVYSATKRRVEANWPALAYLPAGVVAVAYLSSRRWMRWFVAGVVLAGTLSATVYVNAFTPVLPVPARRDPAARAAGWPDLARAVEAVRATERGRSSRVRWVAADRYQDASQLAFHLPDRPEVFSLNLTSRPNHYDLWPGFPERARPGQGMVLVLDETAAMHPTIELLIPHFSRVTRGVQVTLARDGDPVKFLRLWVLDGWRGSWPR